MKFVTYSLLISGEIVLLFLVVSTACGQKRSLHETIVEGQQFAHHLQLPSTFKESKVGRRGSSFDHYAFRVSASSPDVLLISGCKFDVPAGSKSGLDIEICSPSAFAIDTGNAYAVRAADQSEWGRALPMPGYFDMKNPVRRTLKKYLQKPPDQRPMPIPTDQNAEGEGMKYRGKTYIRRSPWISVQSAGDSPDGRILVLGGVDTRKLPDPHSVFMGDPIMAGSFGTITVDIFDTNTGSRLAAVDVDCDMNVFGCLSHASLANARWFAVALDDSLSKILLFDFKPSPGVSVR